MGSEFWPNLSNFNPSLSDRDDTVGDLRLFHVEGHAHGSTSPALSGTCRPSDTVIAPDNPEATPIITSDLAIPEPSISPSTNIHSPPISMVSESQTTAVETDSEDQDSDSDDVEDLDDLTIQQNFPPLEQSVTLCRVLGKDAFDWFLIRIDAISIYTHYLCTTNCSPGTATISQVVRCINQAIQLIRRVQPTSEGWTPQNVPIKFLDKTCNTTLSDSTFRTAFRAEISTARDALIHIAYSSTRKLLVPSHQQLDGFAYPRIVLLQSLNDVETASHWRSDAGDLLWDDRYGYQIFHLDFLDMDGSPAFIWFGRLEVREFLSHFFHQSHSIGFIEVYERVRNDIGFDKWVEITHATDAMLAFGLAWIVAVIEADVLQNRGFVETTVVSKRRLEHFCEIYERILSWFSKMRDAAVLIPGLSGEARAQGVEAMDRMTDLSLPDLTNYVDF